MTADNNAVDRIAAIIHAKGGAPIEMQPDRQCAICAVSRRIARAVLAAIDTKEAAAKAEGSTAKPRKQRCPDCGEVDRDNRLGHREGCRWLSRQRKVNSADEPARMVGRKMIYQA